MKNTSLTRASLSLRSTILLFAVVFLAGCSKPMEEAIIGKWVSDDQSWLYYEFFHDATFIMSVKDQQLSGKWTKVGEDRIKADVPMLGTTRTMVYENIEISGDKLKFTWDQTEGTFTRMK